MRFSETPTSQASKAGVSLCRQEDETIPKYIRRTSLKNACWAIILQIFVLVASRIKYTRYLTPSRLILLYIQLVFYVLLHRAHRNRSHELISFDSLSSCYVSFPGVVMTTWRTSLPTDTVGRVAQAARLCEVSTTVGGQWEASTVVIPTSQATACRSHVIVEKHWSVAQSTSSYKKINIICSRQDTRPTSVEWVLQNVCFYLFLDACCGL